MNENLAYQEEIWKEKLNGEIILMSPQPTVNHNSLYNDFTIPLEEIFYYLL